MLQNDELFRLTAHFNDVWRFTFCMERTPTQLLEIAV